jgi:serine protease Do
MEKKIFKLIPYFVVIAILGIFGGVVVDRFASPIVDQYLGKYLPKLEERIDSNQIQSDVKIVKEESLVIDVVKNVSSSVVTVGIKKTQTVIKDPFAFDPFDFFRNSPRQNPQVEEQNIEQDIGTGFVVEGGLIVTNKHVVGDREAEYKVISVDGEEHIVEKIYRDPTLDLAILQVDGNKLEALILGDSDQLEVGQFVIAIGTALGEFRNTVTTGVVSGLGRGITAGAGFGYSTERLENVIQTDAAINPGNSGGPLLDSVGQAIGVSVATSVGADNISFAIPINVVKEMIDNFNKTGKFERAFLGVKYKMISKDLAILNEIPQGAYLVEVVKDSPADKAGLSAGDIITKFDGHSLNDDEGGLAKLISQKKVGDTVNVDYWRDDKMESTKINLEEAGE